MHVSSALRASTGVDAAVLHRDHTVLQAWVDSYVVFMELAPVVIRVTT